MKRSSHRILTTHAGSLPRPTDLLEMLRARTAGHADDQGAYATRVRRAVAEVVRTQVEHGLDIVDDGEMGKPSFVTYVGERLAGFSPSGEPAELPWSGSKEFTAFPEFYEATVRQSANAAARGTPRACTGPVSYQGHAHVQTDIENLKAALAGVRVEEAFLPAISPANIEAWHKNRYYRTDEEYLFAIAEAMREEYKAIVDAGFLVQIDDPRLVTYYIANPASTVEECRRWAEVRVEALNHALRDIPRDRVRFHTCYGINMGPRVHDMELKDIVDIILKIRAGAYSFEAANPRHEHEWSVWKSVKLPGGDAPDSRGHHAVDRPRRAPGAGGPADRAVRQRGRARERHRRRRLRLRHLRRLDRDPSDHRLGQAQGPDRRRAPRHQAALGLAHIPPGRESRPAAGNHRRPPKLARNRGAPGCGEPS